MNANTRYEVDLPTGAPASLCVALYSEELRKKLAQLLAMGSDRIRLSRKTKDKYCVRVTEGMLSGMQAVVEKKFSLSAEELRATVQVNPFSNLERVLLGLVQVLWVVAAIPTYALVLPFVRFIFLSLIVTILLLGPFMLLAQWLISSVMSLLYSLFGNTFDEPRRAAITEVFKNVPVPDPLASLRKPATARA